ncbi:MAG: hypothetical protein ACI9MC_003144 [Kiritimatiellia bacterium]|jgi:hypothetical protein
MVSLGSPVMSLRLYPLLHRMLIAWVCLLWGASSGGHQLIEHLNTHVFCVQHGVLEHVDGAPDDAGDVVDEGSDRTLQTSIRSAPESSDHHACTFEYVPDPTVRPVASSPIVANVALVFDVGTAEVIYTSAPRGPPLAFAPKTSPPIGS